MWPISRNLATRLRRFVTPRGTPIVDSASSPCPAHEPLDGWRRLDRFLVSDPATTLNGDREHELAQENARSAIPLIGQHGARVVDRTLELFESGQAMASGPVLFVLTVAHEVGDAATRQAALQAIVRVTRAGTLRVPAAAKPLRHWRSRSRHERA
jgi:60 kDa SS-A/Ro ribonucleoprotein